MPRRAALDALSALFTLLITPERLSDLALSHSSPSSHHHHSLSIAPKSPKSHLAHSLRVPMEPSRPKGPAGPLHAPLTPPFHSSPHAEHFSPLNSSSNSPIPSPNSLLQPQVTCVAIPNAFSHPQSPPSPTTSTTPKSWGSPPPSRPHKRFRSIHQAKSQFLVGQSQLEDVQSLGNDKSSANDRQDSAISSKTLQAFSREPKSRYSHRNHHCLPFARESSYEFS